ncbi:putative diguanylate phosphodiesterase (EAL domain) [Campylobacter iguaniorum]|uniref:Putative diguanylate phosphodiesterase (EAL domain) n=1 Tax=Campylobacter iguaniorum TaxID=1244531 RepID=A0A076FDK1_9BACT|nr:EAL domain-containing protein [Campylobacter iguaniorum]AII13884.1 putative diguanylate phosphodiesterase (EAL domain) [Campylobacter iguaniorum]
MLYSQTKERSNRFALALRIATPFIFLLLLWAYTFANFKNYQIFEISMFVLLTVCYVYYTFYMIYHGFNSSFIDPVSKCFTREKISNILQKSIKNGEDKCIVMIGIKNLNDINERYGFTNVDKISYKFLVKLQDFLKSNKIKKVPIGKYIDGYFLMLVDYKESSLNHLLKTFEISLSKNGINNIEIKVIYSIISTKYDSNLNNVLSTLFYKILNNENEKFSAQEYESIIKDALNKKNFIFKFQTIKDIKSNNDMIYASQKLKFDSQSMPKIKFNQIINKIGYEIDYDKEVLNSLFNQIDFNDIKNKLFIEISPVTIRNHKFKIDLFKLVKDKNIDPKKLVFEFVEDSAYSEIIQFREILAEYTNAGFGFALTHFGGNNSSLEYFKYLDVDYIIYDMEFSKNFDNFKFRNLLENMNVAASKLNVKTIIRFVDKSSFYDEIMKTGIDYVQGFCIDKPKLSLKD